MQISANERNRTRRKLIDGLHADAPAEFLAATGDYYLPHKSYDEEYNRALRLIMLLGQKQPEHMRNSSSALAQLALCYSNIPSHRSATKDFHSCMSAEPMFLKALNNALDPNEACQDVSFILDEDERAVGLQKARIYGESSVLTLPASGLPVLMLARFNQHYMTLTSETAHTGATKTRLGRSVLKCVRPTTFRMPFFVRDLISQRDCFSEVIGKNLTNLRGADTALVMEQIATIAKQADVTM
ncbi:MAG: hypothetical protein AAF413_00730 [Patescibacteria group bacterium]